MIQRIQTLFLLAAAILLGISLFMPIWINSDKDITVPANVTLDPFTAVMTRGTIITESGTFYIGILIILAIFLTGFAIMKYTNRALQLRLGMLNNLLLSAVIGTFFIGINTAKGMLNDPAEGQYTLFFLVPPVCIVLNFLAMRFIKKDEELVRSADRIR